MDWRGWHSVGWCYRYLYFSIQLSCTFSIRKYDHRLIYELFLANVPLFHQCDTGFFFLAGNCFYLFKRTVLISMRFFTAPLCHLYCWSVIWCGSLLQSDQTEPFQRRLFLSPDDLLPSTGNLHLLLCTHLPSNRNKWNESSPGKALYFILALNAAEFFQYLHEDTAP